MKFLRPFFAGFLTAAMLINLIIAVAVTHRDIGVAGFWLAAVLVCETYAFVLAMRIEKNDRLIATARAEYIDHLERQVKTIAGYRWSSTHTHPERPS